MSIDLAQETAFRVPAGDGVLVGHRGGPRFGRAVGLGSRALASGAAPTALVLHGGAAVPDYMGPCAAELAGLFTTLRYTQRGTPPSIAGQPGEIRRIVGDFLAEQP